MEPENAVASRVARPKRTVKPSAKSKENATQPAQSPLSTHDDTEASEIEVSEAPPASQRARAKRGRATGPQDLEPEWMATMIKLIQNLEKELKDTREHMSTELEKTRAELRETKEQLRLAQEQLQAIRLHQEQESPQPSYADVARTPPSSFPSNLHTLTSTSTTPSALTDTPFCTIDTSRTPEALPEKDSPSVIRSLVEREMQKMEGQESWRCVAVSRGRERDRIRVICRSTTELETVKEILQKHTAPETRVLRDQLYPIIVDNANRTAILDDGGNVRPGLEEALGRENEVHIAKITWLSNKGNGKAYGSMAVYTTKASEASRLLNKQFFDVAGESANARPYERRVRPLQCYNCQELGHKAYSCGKAQACARCAKEGHDHKECRATEVKCVPCGGPHESFSKSCRRLYPPRHGQ